MLFFSYLVIGQAKSLDLFEIYIRTTVQVSPNEEDPDRIKEIQDRLKT